MILGMIGFFVLIFSTMKDTGVSVVGIIAGIVLILLGLLSIDVHVDNVKIRSVTGTAISFLKAKTGTGSVKRSIPCM